MRISIDCKARVKVGNLSRAGKSRGKVAKKADDHDTKWEESLVPLGIIDVVSSDLSLYFGNSNETSDFIVDCLQMWWNDNKKKYSNIQELVINLDNGASQKSERTQFIKRMVEFQKQMQIRIRLVYYPPYHSKYNPIEHVFGVLENYWNSEILDSVTAVLKYASNMTYRMKRPLVKFIDRTYKKGVTLSKKELEPFLNSFYRSSHLPKWDILIAQH